MIKKEYHTLRNYKLLRWVFVRELKNFYDEYFHVLDYAYRRNEKRSASPAGFS